MELSVLNFVHQLTKKFMDLLCCALSAVSIHVAFPALGSGDLYCVWTLLCSKPGGSQKNYNSEHHNPDIFKAKAKLLHDTI